MAETLRPWAVSAEARQQLARGIRAPPRHCGFCTPGPLPRLLGPSGSHVVRPCLTPREHCSVALRMLSASHTDLGRVSGTL